jgi:hypothetical protein
MPRELNAMGRNDAVLAAVRRRLDEDPDRILPTLRLLADPDALADPSDETTKELARTLNAYHEATALRELRASSYTTSDVAELLGGVSRQAVSARVAKGRLMSIEISGRSYFPSWQFVDGRPVKGIADVIAAFSELGEDTLTADAIMRNELPEEGGRTIADLLAAGDVERALHYIRAVGGGF